MVGGPEQRRERAHVVGRVHQGPPPAEADLGDQGPRLLRQSAGVVALNARRLVAVAIAPHVGDEDGEAGVRERGGDGPPGVAGREEAVP